jgi:Tfp pilus assembly protein PilF
MRLKYSILAALGITFALGIIAFELSRNRGIEKGQAVYAKQTEIRQSLKIAEGLLNRRHPIRALEILHSEEKNVQNFPSLQEEWVKLAGRSAQALSNDELLRSLYTFFPEFIASQEDLSLPLASAALSKGDWELYRTLSQNWLDNSRDASRWVLLQADALALQGKPELSIELLNSQSLKGQDEVFRCLRLALMNQNKHPQVSWEYLTNALKKDPSSGDLHYYRAKLLQGKGIHDLALSELKTAMLNQPQDCLFKEEYIQQCLLCQRYAEAYDLLAQSLTRPTNDRLWLDALFFHKIYKPLPASFADLEIPQGEITPFLRYLLVLPAKQAWNPGLLHSQPKVANIAHRLPEALWLKAIGYLQSGLELKAFKTLYSHPEMAQLNPDLFNSLQIAIAYRYPHLHLQPKISPYETPSSDSFLKKLRQKTYSEQTEKLLASEEGFAALFLAAGWNETALQLHQMPALPDDFPRWLAAGLTYALAQNRTRMQALDFAKQQKPSPQLNLLIGELELKGKNLDKARIYLDPIAADGSDMGRRAAALLAAFYAQQQQYDQARKAIHRNPGYAFSWAGKEQLAAIALKQGNTEEAEDIYNFILLRSPIAKSYFAAKAYQNKDYQKALELTQELLKEFPDRPELQKQRTLIYAKLKEELKKN